MSPAKSTPAKGPQALGRSSALRWPVASLTKWASAPRVCRAQGAQEAGPHGAGHRPWELNEAFAVQVLYCRDKLGIPADRLNVNGGAIALGHPLRCVGPAPHGPRPHRRQAPWRQRVCVTMCIGGGMGAAGILLVLALILACQPTNPAPRSQPGLRGALLIFEHCWRLLDGRSCPKKA